MPYAIPDGGIVQVIFEGKLLSQQMITVLHYQLDNPGGVTDGGLALDAVATQLKVAAGVHQEYLECLDALYEESTIKLQWIIPERHAYKTYAGAFATGQVPAPLVATNIAVAITKRSDGAGAHSHGTIHMPAVPLDFVTDAAVNAAGVLAYDSFRAKVIEDLVTLGSGTYHPVIFRRGLPGDSELIVATTLSLSLRTMHRRTVGLGS